MKSTSVKMTMVAVVAAFAVQIATAQNTSQLQPNQPASRPPGAATAQENIKAPGDFQFSAMRDKTVRSEAGEDLGKLSDLIVDPRTGQIEFAVLNRGGFLGFGTHLVPVPWQKVTTVSGTALTLNITPQQLQGAPALAKDYSNLNSPDFATQVNQHFSVAPSAVGAPGEAAGGTQTGTEQQQNK